MSQTQKMLTARPTDEQLERLRALVSTINGKNRFYSRRIMPTGMASNIPSVEEFVGALPLLSKAEIVEDHRENPPYGSNLTFPIEDYSRFCQTSATMGDPLKWIDRNEDWDWMLDNWIRVFEAAGAKRGDIVYFPFSFGPFLGFWTGFEAACKMGLMAVPGGGLSSVDRIQKVIELGARFICCTPTYSLRLAEVAAQEGIDLKEAVVEKIIVAGEPGGSSLSLRARACDAWQGAQFFDHYGMTEVGPVAFEEPDRPGYLRTIGSSYIAEVVNPQNWEPIAPESGDVGELVLTTLGREGCPVLRYRTGDIVKPVPHDDDDGSLLLDGGIIGRVDDMVVVRGVNLYPAAIDNVINEVGGVSEYRVTVDTRRSMGELSMEVETFPGVDDMAVVRKLESRLRSQFNLRIPVWVNEPGVLPRFEMKAKRWVRVG